MKIMKKLYFLMVTLLVTSLSFGQDLILTGVFDGPLSGGTPKVVEMYVINDIADLSAYGISSANNGGGATGAPEFVFSGSATSGQYLYITSNDAEFTTYFGLTADFVDSAANVNGDDAIELFFNGGVIDVFGDVDVDGNGTPWEYLDGWAYRIDGTGPDGSTFVEANWSYSGPNAIDGCATNDTCASSFPIGTYAATANTDPTITITSPFNTQAFDSGTTAVDVEWSLANAPSGATVNITVTANGGSPVTTNDVTSPFQVGPTADGDTYTVSVELVDGGVLDSDTVDFSVAFPCDLQVGAITETCDVITPATDDTYTVTIDYTGGGTTTYTIDTAGNGTVGGDDPSSVADGTITITGITEGTDFTVTFTGNPANSSCDFTRTINSPDCDPQLTLPLYEGFDYAVDSELRDAPNWANISTASGTDQEILIGGPGGLTYPNFAGSNQTGNHVTFDGGGSDSAIEFTAVTSETLYTSFLINVAANDQATTPGYFAILGNFNARLWTVPGANAGEYQIGISSVNTVPTAGALDPTVLTVGSTVLIVMSYDTATGVMNAWVNPSDTTFGGTAPASNATETGDSISLSQLALRQDSTGETPFILFDELRIGTSWAEVTPSTLSTEDFTSNKFKVYPNPTSLGFVNIASANSEAISVAVYDILGKAVITETLTNNRLNVSTLNSGVYIMKMTQNNASVTKKLIIK
jgi:hypothetical protein